MTMSSRFVLYNLIHQVHARKIKTCIIVMKWRLDLRNVYLDVRIKENVIAKCSKGSQMSNL